MFDWLARHPVWATFILILLCIIGGIAIGVWLGGDAVQVMGGIGGATGATLSVLVRRQQEEHDKRAAALIDEITRVRAELRAEQARRAEIDRRLAEAEAPEPVKNPWDGEDNQPPP